LEKLSIIIILENISEKRFLKFFIYLVVLGFEPDQNPVLGRAGTLPLE
jgi:hypothetical protein